ncbi:hypothetical protein LOY86_002974 [Ophidiomyces ophidiicola]|nr:hypothetical protein LOZ08_002525 [Ophidiomyces ophidiicola]KAI2453485.1 hypothetical protein LOY86_002974 [Ophidiomyces ophidiicola]
MESSSDRPKRSKKAVVQRREELRCHGLKTNKYINKDRLQKIMEDEFCTDAFAQGEVDKEKCFITGRLDKDSGSIARTYLQGTVEEFDIALDFKPGYFPVMNVTECKGTFTYQLIDGCDEKNGENPLDWKAGGVYNSGTVAYRIDPKIERRPAPKVPTAGCQKFKGIIWGRGFGGGDWGKLLLNWLEECNGHHRINLYPQFKYFFDRGEREWELRVKKNKQTAGCVGHAIKMAGGPANAGCDFWQDWVKKLKPSGPQGSELLEQERAKSKLSVDKLAELIHTKETLQKQARLLSIMENEPAFDKSQNHSLGRVERLKKSLGKAKRLQNLRTQHGWSQDEFMMANDLLGEPTPYGLHASMFLVTLREQGTPEQHKRFLEPAEKYEYIGCYAQTELGHGSNVRGLETTATWDPTDKTFVIHSPYLTASKWWIGSLGRTANHAVVMAQLIINGKSFGPHPFVVQVRDLKTHEPLENVHVGDIGPKFGYNTMDNGFLLFNHVKVPHLNMLARFSRVDPDTSKYIRPALPSLVYGTLTWVRSTIVLQSGGVLARGVTIATRYCAIRRQFQDRDAPESELGENQVINYKMVQIRLLPLLAATFALHFTGRGMMALYEQNQSLMKATETGSKNRGAGPEQLNPGADLLADLHATSCGLKALGSTIAVEGLEACRRACGGHGYSSYSGIGPWYSDYLPTVTWEGDNYMLTQQVARYLLKSARAVVAGKAANNDTCRVLKNYLARRDTGAAFDILDNDKDIVDAFAWRTAYLTFEALKHRDVEKRSWNSLLVDFWRLSTAHSQYLIVKNFYEAVSSPATAAALDPETTPILHKLFRLHALHTLERDAADFFTAGAVTTRQIVLTRTKAVMTLLEEIRPHALRLVDAWKFPDWQLDSSLGRYDGKVYEDLFHRASELNPVNAMTFDPYPSNEALLKNERASKL